MSSNAGKNLRTLTPVAMTTTWAVVLHPLIKRVVAIVRNAGADDVMINTNLKQNNDDGTATDPDETTKFFTLPSGQAIAFEYGSAPLVLRARAVATTSTLHVIEG